MSDAGGRPGREDLPYGLTTEQLLAITHAPRFLRNAAEALQLYTAGTEHAIQARHAADWIESAFPEVEVFWQRLQKEALRERQTRPC